MSLLIKGGIAKLSELEIDIDKDWGSYLIRNLGAAVDDSDALRKAQSILQSAMTTKGDILFRDTAEASRLAADAGKGYSFLRSRGSGLAPVWQDIESLIQYLTGSLNRAAAFDLPVPLSEIGASPVISFAGGVSAEPGLSIPAPSISGETKETSVNAVGGAVSHNHDVGDTDETAPANSPDASDMTLLPADGAISDYYALGYISQFDAVCLNVGTAGANYTLAYEYSQGAGAWGSLSVLHNSTNEWKSTGKGWLTFSRPADWAVDTLAGLTLYWIRARATSIGAFTQPKGTQAWILDYS